VNWTGIGACLGALAVVFGAFGAHGLKARVSTEMLTVFETGARYHMYHALALLAVGWMAARNAVGADIAGWLFLIGIVIFSGSLYVMVFSGARWLGAITPIGGTLLIAGWIALAYSAFR